MKQNFSNQLTHPIFKIIQEKAQELNVKAYVIGGYVRDLLLDRPCKDIDVVVLGDGIELAKATANFDGKSRKVSIFKNFGTAMFKYRDYEIEFVGSRKESYNRNSRNPIVEPGTLFEDQNRRDFTVNALSISLNQENFGELIDPFNGLQHLQEGVLKTPLDPDITYSDDPLRMLRAIRFSNQLNFTIHPESLKAIIKNKERISIVSGERIAEELNKIMLCEKPSIGLELLYKTGLLHIFLPELVALQGVEEKDQVTHKDNFFHTLEVVDNISENTKNVWLRYAALFHDVGKAPTKKWDKKAGWTFHGHEHVGAKMLHGIFKRLKLPLDNKLKYVQKLVRLSSRPIAITNEIVTDSGVRRLLFDAGDDIEDLMTLCEADITSKNPARVRKYKANYQRVRERIVEVEARDHVKNFQPPIDGETIMKAFDLKPCNQVGIIKNAIKEAILEGEIQNNRIEAFEFMLKKGSELQLKPIQQVNALK